MTVYNCDKQYSTEPSADTGAGGRGGHIHIKHVVFTVYMEMLHNSDQSALQVITNWKTLSTLKILRTNHKQISASS